MMNKKRLSTPFARPSAEEIALLQGVIFAASGAWPVAHMRSFEAVSGRKTDKWLVRTVGLLIAVVGSVLLRARRAKRVSPEMAMLAAGSAGSLAAIDFVYGLRGTIPRRYLLDGLMQSAFVLLWFSHWLRNKRSFASEAAERREEAVSSLVR